MKTMIDDLGNLRFAAKATKESSLPIHGWFDTANHIAVSMPYPYGNVDFWFVDVVFADDVDQPPFSACVGTV